MSMTPFQSEGLRLLGYTTRESEFLYLVATHSGYFTSRQFQSFAQTESGSVSHAFVRKLLDRKHASYHAYRSGERVYHVFARKVYQAIERENLRTRKKHELEYVKTRLVALDFVLARPEHRYLETESEKIAFFDESYRISREILPVKRYRAKKSADVTPRYFVDRFPMFVDRASSPPSVTFTYIDPGVVTLGGFTTHLRAYFGLFNALPRFELMYLARAPRLFQAAESEFRHVLCGRRSQSRSVSILEYFRLQKAWDERERVASADVILLREAQERYAGTSTQTLYEKWRGGELGDDDVKRDACGSSDPPKAAFRALLCGSSLKVFTDVRKAGTESSMEGDFAECGEQVSGESSVRLPGA